MFKGEILLIDDSLPFCESVVDLFEDETNWRVQYVTDGAKAIEKLQIEHFKVVLLDLKMPGKSGLDVLNELNRRDLIKSNYIIVLTGEITIENAVSSLQFGAMDFFQKPSVVEFPEMFIKRIERGFDWQKERLENEALLEEKNKAIEESKLIVQSVGHDMSGSYYGSLMLRLRTLKKRIEKFDKIVKTDLSKKIDLIHPELKPEFDLTFVELEQLADNALQRGNDIIELMGFFKDLGDSLKHLGNAIDIDAKFLKTVDINYVLNSASDMVIESNFTKKDKIKVIEDFQAKPGRIAGSEEKLLRVFVNIIENAFKAMSDNGILRLTSKQEDGSVIVEIEDNGCGIPKENLDKIWRPDFTRWESSTGTGLGLLICRKTVENIGGTITVDSEINNGTKFTLIFPELIDSL
jgi:signal transduction histidine kinase